MTLEHDWSIYKVTALIAGVGVTATIPGAFWLAAEAQTAYPDVASDYWAQPFIQELSQADILTGYPDGTFRPQQPMDRDEYAAVIRQAFEAEPVRSLSGASSFEDAPEGYWANPAIEEAYETGFMGAPDPNEFEPQEDITRADAIVSLVEGLGLDDSIAPVAAASATVNSAQPVQQTRRASNQLLFPIASTMIMQLFAPPAQAASAAAPPAAQATGINPDAGAEVGLDLSQYYTDAEQIPEYARDEVATATKAGLIVNYPDPAFFNPNRPITRGETAAIVHRALVYQNKLEPLSETAEVSQYIVDPFE